MNIGVSSSGNNLHGFHLRWKLVFKDDDLIQQHEIVLEQQ